jgi:hypothetical protein
MRLHDLGAMFLKVESDGWRCDGIPLAEADGIIFQCPKCSEGKDKAHDGGYIGAHSVVCWFVGRVPDMLTPKGRWMPSGTGLDNLTFVGPGANSVLLTSGCGAHFHVKDGAAA